MNRKFLIIALATAVASSASAAPTISTDDIKHPKSSDNLTTDLLNLNEGLSYAISSAGVNAARLGDHEKRMNDHEAAINDLADKTVSSIYELGEITQDAFKRTDDKVADVEQKFNDFKNSAGDLPQLAKDAKAAASEASTAARGFSGLSREVSQNTANINRIQGAVNRIDAIDANNTQNARTVAQLSAKVDTYDTRINALTDGYNRMDNRVYNLEKDLSAGIAGTVAMASMPAPISGGHYVTGGMGVYNGQRAAAVGLTGATETGKFSYKIGGAVASEGSSSFGIGAGYRWK